MMSCVWLQAERMFSEVRRIESYRVEGMEIYSTTLWHLQKDVALSTLSKDLTDMDKNCPEVRPHHPQTDPTTHRQSSLVTEVCVCVCARRPGVWQETASVCSESTTSPSSSSKEPFR